ncbi:MAG: tRNA (N6-isopentenyl adenosine(37)-C2)-methylthiotransferase MiaB [Chloroflexi bacterium]|nr:tRNA (N6-isopentenyl adenosine(37)-C2)-methylthiotransferase MiaB [Chloroflexota bacterium]
MLSYHIWTLGCQMNKADSGRLAAQLEQCGCQLALRWEAADLLIINSCSVRQSAEDRASGRLSALKTLKKERKDLAIALVGCMVDSNIEDLKRRFPHVDFFLPPQGFEPLIRWVQNRSLISTHERVPPPPVVSTPSAFVPIIEGCDNFCTYCIVPYRRGRERSRPPQEILGEVEALVQKGAKEVVLLGQNVDSYGHDLPKKPDLAELLTLLNSVPGLVRIRFLTSHPKDMGSRLIETVARLDKVCEHISLPAQSGDDEILQAMGRGYIVAQYRQLIARLRSAIPGVALSTDVIVGFPGETEVQFGRTLSLLEDIRFDTVHVAAYSPRPGTVAARSLHDDVPSAEKERRLHEVECLQEGIASAINARLLGQRVEVLVLGKQQGKWFGRTRMDKLVFFPDDTGRTGQLVQVKVERTSPWALQGVSL